MCIECVVALNTRLFAPLPAALLKPQSSQILRDACSQPAEQSPGDARTCVNSYKAVWGELGTLVKKQMGSGKNTPCCFFSWCLLDFDPGVTWLLQDRSRSNVAPVYLREAL